LEDYDDDKIGNGDDRWASYFPPLVDFIMFDAERDRATVCAVEKNFPQGSDGDESAVDIWIREM
jgi:hypothetical protein